MDNEERYASDEYLEQLKITKRLTTDEEKNLVRPHLVCPEAIEELDFNDE